MWYHPQSRWEIYGDWENLVQKFQSLARMLTSHLSVNSHGFFSSQVYVETRSLKLLHSQRRDWRKKIICGSKISGIFPKSPYIFTSIADIQPKIKIFSPFYSISRCVLCWLRAVGRSNVAWRFSMQLARLMKIIGLNPTSTPGRSFSVRQSGTATVSLGIGWWEENAAITTTL